MKKHYLLFIGLFFLSNTNLLAQPSVTPAAGYIWVCTSSGTYDTGAQSTTPGVPDDTSYGINGNPPDQGCAYAQQQLFGNLGDSRNTTGCGGTAANANYPISSTEMRSISLNDWNNPSPASGVANGATTGTICVQTSATLRILPSANPGDPGTGAGGDEMRLEVIGGNSGAQSDFALTASYDLNWSDTRFGTSGGSGVQTVNQASLTVNDAGSGNNYEWTTTSGNNTWLFSPTQVGIGNTYGQDFVVTSLEDGGAFAVDFTSSASVGITRNFGNADARAQFGPGMQGLVSYEVDFKCWEIQPNPLAVNLTSFDAKKENDLVKLNWTSALEENFDYYEIQTSKDSKSWDVIGKISGDGQAAYGYHDTKPTNGLNYYRLKMVDIDESFSFSKVVSIDFFSKDHIALAPNPVVDQLNAIFELDVEAELNIQIFNINGQLMTQQTQLVLPGRQTIEMDCVDLNSGMYFMTIRNAQGSINWNQKFLKK